MTIEVVESAERTRFEAVRGGTVLGFAEFHRTDDLVVFTHTEVDPQFEGQGVGGTLVRGALEQVRAEGRKALPVCPFVQAWLRRHPDYLDLDYRARPGARGGNATAP